MTGNDEADDRPADVVDEVAQLRSRNEALERDLQTLREAGDRRAVDAELRLEAQKRGIIDLDGLKLIDESAVTVDSGGAVQGVQAALTRLRKDKPWLFASASSSSISGAPTATTGRTKLATEMTLDEWRLAKSVLLQRG